MNRTPSRWDETDNAPPAHQSQYNTPPTHQPQWNAPPTHQFQPPPPTFNNFNRPTALKRDHLQARGGKRALEGKPEPRYFSKEWREKRGSGGLAPSKSTIYLANLPFSLTNNDLHKILEKFGRCIKVTIVKDSEHRSKGIAFALFIEREPCIRIINTFHGKQLFGRTLKCCFAKDNGRTREFIRRKEYPDKSQCYECGEFGHLSYKCSKNLLGERRRPRRKKKKRKEKEEVDDYYNDDISLAEAIAEEFKLTEERLEAQETSAEPVHRKRYVEDSYFSDEETLDET